MKVLLLSPPYLPFYMRNARCDFVSLSGTQWYPILLGYLGAWLKKCGHDVTFIDAPANQWDHERTFKEVVKSKHEWLVVYTGRISEENDLQFADRLSEKMGCKLIFVGPYASVFPEKTLKKSNNGQYLVTGEFEKPVEEIISGFPPEKVANLVYKKNGEIITNGARPYLKTEDLDAIPFVSQFFKENLNIKQYRAISEPHPFMDILTGRGCQWGHCTYCLWVNSYIKGAVYNFRSIENVIAEFKYIETHVPEVKGVMIQDDTFVEERALAFSEAKFKAGSKIPWSCYARGNMSYETLQTMKKANCLNLHVGFESADSTILKKIKKGITKERMTRFASDAKKAGLQLHGDFAIGFPGESKESVAETVNWACEMRPHTAQFQLMIPFPGTRFYDELKEKDWLKDGSPHYPDLPSEEMEALAKEAYRKFYISLPFALQVLKHPYELLFSRLGIYSKALPSIFWKKYVR